MHRCRSYTACTGNPLCALSYFAGSYALRANGVLPRGTMILVNDSPAGQSNMQWAMQSTEHVGEEAPAANHPNLRLFQIDTVVAPQPLDDVQHR